MAATLLSIALAAVVITDAKDQVIRAKFLGHATNEVRSLTFQDVPEPETLCWVQFPKLNMALTAYELTGDATHLQNFTNAFEKLRATVKIGPDGFLGWYGRPAPTLLDPAKPNAVISEIQTDFRAAGVLSRYMELAGKQPEYLDLLENHLVAKWEKSFTDLGEHGGVYQWNTEYLPAKAGITLSHEKQAIIIEGLLNLYRVTGKDAYRQRAAKLGMWLKHCLQLKEGRYVWNFWDPAGPWDEASPGKWKHWLGTEPKEMWYAATVRSAVLLFQHGVVFDRADIDRLLKTQLEVCWQGDSFFQTDGNPAQKGERFIAPALAPYNLGIFEYLYTGPRQDERVEKADNWWHGGILAGDWLQGKYIKPKGIHENPP